MNIMLPTHVMAAVAAAKAAVLLAKVVCGIVGEEQQAQIV
jgi:hypothetical protein